MKHIKSLLGIVAVVAVSAAPVWAVSIEVTPSLAPNAFGSPSYANWVNNAVAALETGAPTAGTPGTPDYYQALANGTNLAVSQNIVTGFPSWNGQASPSGAFSSELGNRVAFGVFVDGDGQKIDIANLSFVGTSTDPSNSLGFAFPIGSYAYSSNYVGIIWNNESDHSLGFTTDTTGPATDLVDAIVGRGSGNAWAAYETDLPPTTDQGHIDAVVNSVWSDAGSTPFDFSGTYSYGTGTDAATGMGNVVFSSATPVPLPASAGIGFSMLAGFGSLFAFRKRLSRRPRIA